MDRYIGLDAHTSSCTVAVMGQSGKRLHSQVVETNARALIEVIRAVPEDRHLCIEEGPHSNWLYEVLSPHVQEIVVAVVNESRGPNSDRLDAFGLAEQLRVGAILTKVDKKRGGFARLGYRVNTHALLVADSVRVRSRIKALVHLSRYRRDSRRANPGGCGDSVSVWQQACVLVLLWFWDRDAQLIGLGAWARRSMDQSTGAADARLEPQLQPPAQGCVQGSGHAT